MNKNKHRDKVIQATTCHAEHKKCEVQCEMGRKSCKYWHDAPERLNCIMIAASEGEHTLQEIGDLFGVTRMRICQIEKLIFKKLLNKQELTEVKD